MANITVDFSKVIGKMKPVHGIGQPPIRTSNTELFRFLKDAGIPFSRLHDVGGYYGASIFVDIPNIFRDFDADENDPKNYDFVWTDILIKGLKENGVEPVYRLGVTIEQTEFACYRVFPPKDYEKWARICEHVIMHYNEGWANGFNHDIKYWEIWNEPDNAPDEPDTIIHNHMWQAKREEFYKLYAITAKHLKNRFPNLKIGGYGSCGFYAIHQGGKITHDISNSSPRFQYFITFFEEFMEYISKEKAPLDFFSWHNYRGPEGVKVYAQYVRDMLDKYGYTEAESSCNEWSVDVRIGTPADCAVRVFVEMLAYQNSCVDNAMAYDGRCTGLDYALLFDAGTQKPRLAYYCFKNFNRLYTLKNQTEASTDDDELVIISASDGKRGGIIIINTGEYQKELNFNFDMKFDRCYITEDDLPDFESTILPKKIYSKGFITILCDVE